MRELPTLRPGDKVALVGASSAVPEERLAPAVAAVAALGLEPVVYPSCYYANRHGSFAAEDDQRAEDVTAAFLDEGIRGVLCIRGGYGAGRLLPRLDFDALVRHPKVFAGYSDVTALHLPLNQRGLVTYHTVMPSTEYYQPLDRYTEGYLRRALFGSLTGPLELPEGWTLRPLRPGVGRGRLCGGNLSLVAASLGTPWELDASGKVIFLEDVGEEPYRVDGMLTHLKNAGIFRRCAGVALGYWTDCKPDPAEAPGLELGTIFQEILGDLDCPVVMDLPCGHSLPSMSLPLGAEVVLDADRGRMEVCP